MSTHRSVNATRRQQALLLGSLICAAGAILTPHAFSQQPAAPGSAPATSATTSPAAMLKPDTAPAPVKLGSVTLSGSLRLRVENWDWFEAQSADNDYTFGAATLRVGVGQQTERVDWLVEGEVPVLMGVPTRSVAPAPQGQLGLGATYFAANGRKDASVILKQGFVRFKGLFGDKASSLRLGRFEFNDGTEVMPADATLATVKRDHISQRLIGAFGFSHVGRSFDGAQFARNFKAGNLTFVAARPTEGVFQLDGNRELDVDFYYGAFTRPLKHKQGESELRAFVLHYHDGRRVLKTDNRPQLSRTADTSDIRLNTIGGHYIGAYKAGRGKVDLLLWGAAQLGDWGTLDHTAGAIAIEGGYTMGGSKLADRIKPWVRFGYYRSSGDDDPADGNHGTFFTVLPTPRIYARTPFFNGMNNEDLFGQLRFKPHHRLLLRFDAHHLRVSNAKDLWYVGGGAFQKTTFGYVSRPSNGKQGLGSLFDASADVSVTSRAIFTLYVAGIRGGGVQSAIYPLGGSNPAARFAYVELTQRF
jgi:hypothetical protein